MRASMSRLYRAREDWQREPAAGHAHTSRQPVEATLDEMRTAPHYQDQAAVQLQRADLSASGSEQRLRTLLPRPAEALPDRNKTVPQWLAPRDIERDAHTPTAWRTHLSERRQTLTDRLAQTGRELAADPPAWTRPLGPVPEQGTELRETWERTATLADAWRTRHQTRPIEPGIGPHPNGQQDAAAWDDLHEQVAATRGTAGRPAGDRAGQQRGRPSRGQAPRDGRPPRTPRPQPRGPRGHPRPDRGRPAREPADGQRARGRAPCGRPAANARTRAHWLSVGGTTRSFGGAIRPRTMEVSLECARS
ncbi:hypothetical protein YWIDRAFT_08031 [Streptomyces sp. SceaMP-e96]|nr:hypothetical protein YWIDRAFT_08031 [Streptomyces sp. SceaMP-e96]